MNVKDNAHYKRYLSQYTLNSVIINDIARLDVMNTPWMSEDKKSVLTNLMELKGSDDDGYYTKNRTKTMSLEASLELKIEEMEKQWKRIRQNAINGGKRPPAEMDDRMMADYAKLKARLEVCRLEIQKCEKILSEMDDKVTKERSSRMLKGRLGVSSLRHGILDEVDGQMVGRNDQGELVINQPDSPYNQLQAWKYTAFVVKPYMREWARRERQEGLNAKHEKRPYSKQNIKRPELPKWIKKTDSWEYPDYDESIIKQIDFKSIDEK